MQQHQDESTFMRPNDSISQGRAKEQLRQERDAFDQQKWQAARWFLVRQIVVGSSMSVVLTVFAISICIILHSRDYPSLLVGSAGTAVFGEILCAMVYVWKTTLTPEWNKPVQPITTDTSQREDPIFFEEAISSQARSRNGLRAIRKRVKCQPVPDQNLLKRRSASS